MAISVTYNEAGTIRTTLDDMNPRIYDTDYKCCNCEKWTAEEEVMIVEGKYYCEDCGQEESELEYGEEQTRRDEKNGLYGGLIDDAN